MPMSSNSVSPENLKAIFSDDSSFASSLLLAAVNHFGYDMLGNQETGEPMWHPATVLQEIEEDFNIKLPQGNFDRLMAALTIATTDFFYNDTPTFIHICNVLAGSPITDDFDPASVLEMAWAITESNILSLDPGEDPQFTEEIQAYIVEMCKEEGIVSPPWVISKVIGTAQQGLLSASNFSDQPDLFQGVWYNQQVHTLEVQKVIQSNLWKLYDQLKLLATAPEVKRKLVELQNTTSTSIQELQKQITDLAIG